MEDGRPGRAAPLHQPAGVGMAADLAASRRLDLDPARVTSVAMFVGPYRNLTTLLAGLLALHPHCQVLNHGGERIPAEANPFATPDRAHLDDFVRYAVHISSTGGAMGTLGGSIRASHAFQHEPLRARYEARFATEDRKADIRSVAWKESMFVTRRLREAGDVDALLDALPPLRFLLPIRHPLDCAASNARLGMAHSLGRPGAATAELVDVILDTIAWFLDLEDRRPDRFTHLWQDDVGADRLTELAGFLGLEADERWLDDAAACCRVTPGYEHDRALVARYCEQVEERFAGRAEVRDRLLALAG